MTVSTEALNQINTPPKTLYTIDSARIAGGVGVRGQRGIGGFGG